MKISVNKTLQELQAEFNGRFPYLRLVFFRAPQLPGGMSALGSEYAPDTTVAEACQQYVHGYMPLHGYQKVGDFEHRLEKTFGLHAQVHRKSFGQWLQTWATDIWTLDEQNNRGRVLGDQSRPFSSNMI
ncbi:MAG: hypothetical protein AAFO94_03000 [Bacteroidota bacterium]